jgi:hypothetical protein
MAFLVNGYLTLTTSKSLELLVNRFLALAVSLLLPTQH